MEKRVRLADVAAAVGVSPKTVSNVVNDTGWVSEPVKAKIRTAIDELGYRPNLAARQLRNGSNNLVAFAVPNIAKPYFAQLAAGLVTAARAQDATLLIVQCRGNRPDEIAVIEGEGFPALGGIIMSPLALTPDDLAARRSRVPLLLLGEHGQSLATPEVTHIGPDNVGAARTATEHLLRQGRRRIAAVGLQSRLADTAHMRFAGYRLALEHAGIRVDEDLLVEVTDFNRAEGSRAIEELLARGVEFDGVFCFNDTLAFGALHTLARHGLSVPEQVAVMGFENIEESQYTVPPLPTIDSGVVAASSLIIKTLLEHDHARGGHVEVPYSLVHTDEHAPPAAV